jgi:hypothetical protein
MIRAIENVMCKFKAALGLPQSVSLFGLIKACPILLGLITLAVVVLVAAFLS